MSTRRLPFVVATAAVMVLSVVLSAPGLAAASAGAHGSAAPTADLSVGPVSLPAITGPYTIIGPSCPASVSPAPITVTGLTYTVTGAFVGAIVDECPNSVVNGGGFTITPSSGTPFAVQVNTTSGATVEDVVVGGTPTEAVDVENSTDSTVTNVISPTGADYGVTGEDDDGLTITDCQLNDTSDIGIAVADSQNLDVSNTYATGSEYGFDELVSEGITITNLSAFDNDYGIFLDGGTNVALTNDNVVENDFGILATGTDNLTVTGVNASGDGTGVEVELADATTLIGSNLSESDGDGFAGVLVDGLNVSDSNLSGAGFDDGIVMIGTGISFWDDSLNSSAINGLDLENVTDASVGDSWGSYDGWNGLRVADSSGVSSWENIYDNTTDDGNGTEFLLTTDSSATGDQDSSDAYGLIDFGSSHLSVNDVNATNDSFGFTFVRDSDLTVTNSTTLEDTITAIVFLCNNVAIVNETALNTTQLGFEIEGSNAVSVSNSVLVGSAWGPSGVGFIVEQASAVTLFNDSVVNFGIGEESLGAIRSTLDQFNDTNSTNAALVLDGTTESTVEDSNFSSSAVGFVLDESGPDWIIGNTFFNDTYDFEFQANELTGFDVYWNNFVDGHGWSIDATGATGTNINFADGYPGGGNYWSNWTGPDTMSGPLQNLPGPDGIVDHPLPIQGTIQDPYPLTREVSLADTSVEFIATGLPSGTSWTVNFNGTTGSTTSNSLIFSTNTAALGISLGYTVPAPSGWKVSSPSGTVVTNGAGLVVLLAYTPVTYVATFTQTGLPAGTPWAVTINGSTYGGDTGSVITSLPNGTYNYTVNPVAGYTVAPASGEITIASAGSSTPVTFSAVEYTVDFTEHGLPEGTTWSVTFNGVTKSLPSSTISFAIANGSFDYTIGSVSGYSVADASGTQEVAGPGASVQVAFTANSSSLLGTGSPLFWALIAAIAILAVALVAVLLMGRRKPPASANAWTPPPAGGAPTAAPPPPPPAGGGAPPPGAVGNPPDWKE